MLNEDQYSNFNYYQNANGDADAIKAGFLIRQKEYGIILDDLIRHRKQHSVQHFLILGRRGSGKSTLLRRLQVEIDTDEKLQKAYIAINLAEEQANIYRLFDLLEEIIRELECREIAVEWPEPNDDLHVYSRELFGAIHQAIEKSGRQLVLLLDNVERIFENLQDETALLREYLQNYTDIKIIGGSTRMTEHFWKYNQPFYEFFRVLELKPLSSKDVRKLLLSWSEKLQAPALKDFVENRPGQLETIRILTDGLPRTLQFFVNILLTNIQETGYAYLRLLMDKVTPMYQERLNNLPPSQRKIVLQMAFCWEAVGAKELAEASRMENRVISAQLAQLTEKGIADKIETGKKNHLYRLSERFFNLWLIFTQGNPREKRRARYLSIFLENFYEEEDLREMAEKHLENIREGKVSPDKAALLTKAFSQSRYIPYLMRDRLIDETLKLSGVNEDLKKELPATVRKIIDEIDMFAKIKNWDKAISLIQSIEQDDGIRDYLSGIVWWYKREYTKAEEFFLKSLAKEIEASSTFLGSICFVTQKFDLAEKYFKASFEKRLDRSSYMLSNFYYNCNKNKAEALNIFQDTVREEQDDIFSHLLPVLQAWNGDFVNLEENVLTLVRAENSMLEFTLPHLLIHHQVNLVHRLFTSEEFGEKLVEKFAPLYYAVQMLMPDAQTAMLKIPPEILDVVNDLLKSIHKLRDFYYNTPSPR